jgi:hypothetical protein
MVGYAGLPRLLGRTILPAAVGALLTAPAAAWLIGLNHRVNQAQQNLSNLNFTAALAMLVFVLAVLPLGSWLILWTVRTPASGKVMLLGWICTLVLVLTFAGGTQPYWAYGLCALGGYGVSGLAVALLDRPAPTGPRSEAGTTDPLPGQGLRDL